MKKMISTAVNMDLGLFLVRLGLAVVFIVHGIGKFANMAGSTAFFAGLGLGELFVYLVGIVEILGGLAMLLGIWTRIAGWGLALVMLFAIILVKGALGFSGGYEFDLVLLLTSLAVSFMGPGNFTVEKWMGRGEEAGN